MDFHVPVCTLSVPVAAGHHTAHVSLPHLLLHTAPHTSFFTQLYTPPLETNKTAPLSSLSLSENSTIFPVKRAGKSLSALLFSSSFSDAFDFGASA